MEYPQYVRQAHVLLLKLFNLHVEMESALDELIMIIN
jgi:hypothetical protein